MVAYLVKERIHDLSLGVGRAVRDKRWGTLGLC